MRTMLTPFLLSLIVLWSCQSNDDTVQEEETPPIEANLRVLLYTQTTGFDHNTRSECEAMMNTIAGDLNFELVVDDTGAAFDSASDLNGYSIVFFSNTSGDHLTPAQRQNVEGYAAQGGNFISNHAASDAYGHTTASSVNGNGKGLWDWYAENVTGCSVRNNPNHTASGFAATVTVSNPNESLTNGIGFPWEDREEWYYWESGYLDASFTALLQVSETGTNSFDAPRMTAQFWERPDGGKSFYTSMGHARSKYTDEEFVQLMTNAFRWALDSN